MLFAPSALSLPAQGRPRAGHAGGSHPPRASCLRKERTWARNQTQGELDDNRLIDSALGERAVYKRRASKQPLFGRRMCAPPLPPRPALTLTLAHTPGVAWGQVSCAARGDAHSGDARLLSWPWAQWGVLDVLRPAVPNASLALAGATRSGCASASTRQAP